MNTFLSVSCIIVWYGYLSLFTALFRKQAQLMFATAKAEGVGVSSRSVSTARDEPLRRLMCPGLRRIADTRALQTIKVKIII